MYNDKQAHELHPEIGTIGLGGPQRLNLLILSKIPTCSPNK